MITPMDIHNKTFSKSLRGYSEEEVNDFLQQIVTDYEQIYREHREMEEQMDQMKTKLANYEKISETMANTLDLAKETAERVKTNAKKNADILVANAHAESQRQVREATESRRRLLENIIRTEGNMKTYVGKIRKDLQLALAAIDALEQVKAPAVAGMEEEKAAPEVSEAEKVETESQETAAPDTQETRAAETENEEIADAAELAEEQVEEVENAVAEEAEKVEKE